MAEERVPQGRSTDDLQNELNVDASMFSDPELAEIQNSIDSFFAQLKRQEKESTHKRLLTPPLKRVFVLPVIIFCISLFALLLASTVFLNESRPDFLAGLRMNTSWIDSLFAVRVNVESNREVSEGTRQLIAGIRDESEGRLVRLFVDLINTESAEQSVESVEETAEITTRKQQINSDLTNIQQEQDGELQRRREELQEQAGQFESLQGEFTTLSTRYEQANLQADQYAAIVSEIDEGLKGNDATRTTAALGQLNSLISSSSLDSNPLLEDLQNIAPVLIYSAQLNLTLRNAQQVLIDDAKGNTEASSSVEELNARIDELVAENQQLGVAVENAAESSSVGELNARINRLVEENRQLGIAAENTSGSAVVADTNARISELTQENRQLNLELEQMLFELERVRQ